MEAFKPRHVVAIVVSLCAAAVLTPVAVGAATGTLTNITDPVAAANKARVSNRGGLYVSEADPYNGQFGRVDATGRRLVGDGSGALDVVQAPPAKQFATRDLVRLNAADNRQVLATGVGTRKLTLTSLVVTTSGGVADTQVQLQFTVYVKPNASTGSCDPSATGFTAAEQFLVFVPMNDTRNVTWPTGFTLTSAADANDLYCFAVDAYNTPANATTNVAAYGYYN